MVYMTGVPRDIKKMELVALLPLVVPIYTCLNFYLLEYVRFKELISK